jgi:para-aminobenzoate synthetase / 4-amino-4-deoxychorismate lyase
MTPCAPDPVVILDFFSREGKAQRVCFTQPLEIVIAHSLAEVRPALRAVQQAADRGLYAAGYVAYEAAPAFDSALVVTRDAAQPLLWFGIFVAPAANTAARAPGEYQLSTWQPSVSRNSYEQHIALVRAALARGDTYQVNYTLRMLARFAGDELAFYQHLQTAQRAQYAAYLNTGRYRILSASPELFFRRQGRKIITRPMKGTVSRGRWGAEDDAQIAWLSASEKNRAENVMIVDLVRNDLGRIAALGSVHVPRLFDIERYPTVFQMTSTVTARVRPETTLEDIFTALFPCGSVTGAPKVSTMRLISQLESAPRNVYCGAIGLVAPQAEAVFNVAIRTVVIDTHTGTAAYGVGGGITWDSTAEEEYTEALAKTALLDECAPPFELLETMRLAQGRYYLLARHLERLATSAQYFDVPLSIAHVRARLAAHAKLFAHERRRVRLLIAQDGEIRVESEPLEPLRRQTVLVALARTPVSRHDRFLYHKTTRRAVYEVRRAEQPAVFDVLLWNEAGELTEFTTGNLVLELDGQRWTPPRASGLLAGTLRAQLLRRGAVKERVLTQVELAQAARCWLINSVRGWIAVSFPHAG